MNVTLNLTTDMSYKLALKAKGKTNDWLFHETEEKNTLSSNNKEPVISDMSYHRDMQIYFY